MSTVTIRLIRDSVKKSGDDVIKVFRVGEMMRVQHTDRDGKNDTSVRTTLDLTQTGLDSYVETLLRFFVADEDPFQSIQFVFPGFPMILVSRDSLDCETRTAIKTAAAIVCESWFADCACNSFTDDAFDY